MALVLEAVDIRGPSRWRWLLTDEGAGNPLADHLVRLDATADEVAAFGHVYEYAPLAARRPRWPGRLGCLRCFLSRRGPAC